MKNSQHLNNSLNTNLLMNTAPLQEIGLTENETKIYVSLLKRGSAPASKVAEDLGFDRTTTYYMLLKLQEKGFVSSNIKENVKYFSSTNPEHINELLKQKQKNFENSIADLKKITQTEKKDVKVEVFKGLEAIHFIYKDGLKTGGEFVGWGIDEQNFYDLDYLHFKQYTKEVDSTRALKEKLITFEGCKTFGAKTSEYRFIPKEFFHNIPIAVYGNKTIIIIWEPVITTILIESEDLAKSFRKHFYKLWRSLKKRRPGKK